MLTNLKLEINDGIAVLTINRPESLNALHTEMIRELSETLTSISEKSYSQVRVLILISLSS